MSSQSDTKDGLEWIAAAIIWASLVVIWGAEEWLALEQARACLQYDVTPAELSELLDAIERMDDESIAAGEADRG